MVEWESRWVCKSKSFKRLVELNTENRGTVPTSAEKQWWISIPTIRDEVGRSNRLGNLHQLWLHGYAWSDDIWEKREPHDFELADNQKNKKNKNKKRTVSLGKRGLH